MYTLRFPFELPVGQAISDPKFEIALEDLVLSLKKPNRFYVLTVKGFPSEESANTFISKLWAGLMWLLLNRELASNAETELQEVKYAKDPVKAAENLRKSLKIEIEGEVHGFMDGARPAVYPTNGNFRTITGGQINLLVSAKAEDVSRFLLEGTQFPNAAAVFMDAKLRTALELYSAYFSEMSQRAKFLTLVMVLEALSVGRDRPKLILDLLDCFHTRVEKVKSKVEPNSQEASALESLKRELFFRKKDSIRSQIRALVHDTLSANGDADATDIARNAVKIYDKRSTLVHEGSLPPQELSKVSSDVRTIVERVLKARFVIVAS